MLIGMSHYEFTPRRGDAPLEHNMYERYNLHKHTVL